MILTKYQHIWNYLNNFTWKLFDKLDILELNWNKSYLDKYDGKKNKFLSKKTLIVNNAMLRKTYRDRGTLMNIWKKKKPMVVKHYKVLLTKDDQTTKDIIFWNCEEDDINDGNY